MSDDKDAEIAALKAQLAEGSTAKSGSAASGFLGGFFGCFGVAAAIVVVVIVLVIASSVTSPRPDPRPAATADANTLVNSGHCVNGLAEAQRKGLVSEMTSALAFPWDITERKGDRDVSGRSLLTCRIRDGQTDKAISVEVLCADSEREDCSRLISVSAR